MLYIFVNDKKIGSLLIYVLYFSFETLQKAFVGVHKVIQANDDSDLEQTTVEEQLRANDRN